MVLGYNLSEEEEQILSRQMHLVYFPIEGRLWGYYTGSRLAAVEQAAASKLLQYVHRTQMRIEPSQTSYPLWGKDFLQMDYATKASLDLVENARSGRSKAVFSG